jgi:cation diffusion facilitator CzcD-associated flavoprotein CzcO
MSRPQTPPRIAIVGSGFSGLCLAIQLVRAGIRSFTILEKEERLGGTWRDNTYPGACCDVPSIFYCFSFEQRTDWPRKWSPQSEILDYMDHCAEKYGILPHVRFGTEAESARFDESAGVWRIRTSAGDEIEAEVLVSGVGQLHKPQLPDIPGLGGFRGIRFHSARWRHDVDLAGKRVGVIGNAASAIQFIPQIAPDVERLVIFQRTPNWMIPRGDRPYGEREQRWLARVPGLARLYRTWIWGRAELLLFPAVRGNRFLSRLLQQQALRYMHEQIQDPELRRVLTPDYPVCGKRVLISDDYFAALRRENVELRTAGVERVTEDGVLCKDGSRHALDVLILATGFDTTHFVSPLQVEGLGGRTLEQTWKDGAEAYLGLTVAGFPNFFLMYGPNTNLGHNSIIFMIECQTRYILECVKRLRRGDLRYLDLRPEVMAAYNRQVQQDLRGTAWDRTAHSWYKNAAGRITNNWPHSTLRYWWETRRVDWSAYRLVGTSDPGEDAAAERRAA